MKFIRCALLWLCFGRRDRTGGDSRSTGGTVRVYSNDKLTLAVRAVGAGAM